MQALFGKLRRIRCFLDFGRINGINHQRHHQHGHEAGQKHGQGPSAPAQMNIAVGGFGNNIHHQRVGRGGGDKHRRGNRVAVVIHERQIFADAPLRAFFGVGIIARGNRLHHRVDNAAAARRVARRYRRQQQFGQRQAIADADGFLAPHRDKQIADARAQPCFQNAARNHNRHADKPNQRAGKAAQRIFHRIGRLVAGDAGERHQHNRNHRNRADGHGLADNRRNHAHKHRQQMPSLRRHPVGHGNDKPDNQRQPHRNSGRHRLEAELAFHELLLEWCMGRVC